MDGLWTAPLLALRAAAHTHIFKVSANMYIFVSFQNMHVQILCMEGFSVYLGVFNLFWLLWDKELSGTTQEIQEYPVCSLQISRAYICLLFVILGHSIVYKVSP